MANLTEADLDILIDENSNPLTDELPPDPPTDTPKPLRYIVFNM